MELELTIEELLTAEALLFADWFFDGNDEAGREWRIVREELKRLGVDPLPPVIL